MNTMAEQTIAERDPTYVECIHCDREILEEPGDAHENCFIEFGIFGCLLKDMSSKDLLKTVNQFDNEMGFTMPYKSKNTDKSLIIIIVWHLNRINPRYNRRTNA